MIRIIRLLSAQVGPEQTLYGRRIKVVDGSSLSMPDTPANQHEYPQPKAQKPGCGFPVMRIVVCFCLATGAVIDWATGPLKKGEQTLWTQLWKNFEPEDIVLADRYFASFANYCLLLRRGVDSVMRLHPRRSKSVKVLKCFSRGDVLVEWTRSGPCPDWLAREEWDALPKTIQVRHVTFTVGVKGFRTRKITVATTLTDPEKYPAEEIAQLVRRRWMAELFLRDIKVTMQMDVLRSKSPDMIEREFLMHLIGYNLVRALMWTAAQNYPIDVHRLSFKSALQLLREWSGSDWDAQSSADELLLYAIAMRVLPQRPDRSEPRAKKRRPKNYQYLTCPRCKFDETPHRSQARRAEAT